MNRWMVMALCGAMAVGCGASNEGNTVVDSGTTNPDTGSTVDAGTSTDRGTAATDRGTAMTDRGTAMPDTGVASEFGVCGMDLRTALCTCGNNQSCQQTAIQTALMNSTTCASCNQDAIVGCCPDQVAAFQTCANNSGCTTQACAQMMCATQYNAIGTCFQAGSMSDAACQTLIGRCFGDGFPMITCGG